MNYHLTKITNTAKVSLAFALAIVTILAGTYFAMEPSILSAQATETNTFTIKQTIGDAIAFSTPEAGVTMVGSIDGVAGGQATGTAMVVVTTNDPDGYNMTISFTNATSAMRGDTTGSIALRDYGPSDPNVPDFDFTASGSAQFAYSVNASNTSDVVQLFRDNDVSCDEGAGTPDDNKCWMRPSDGSLEIINRSTAADAGATTTIKFVVHVPNAPVPALPADIYTATATLTATNNP